MKAQRAPQPDLFDLAGARTARDEGIARVERTSDDWLRNGLVRIRLLPRGYEGIAEEICECCELAPPPSPGAVGALIRHARERGLIERTGKMKPPRRIKSHARETYVWRRT